MHSNDYLYGEDVEVPEFQSYIIMRRIELLREHLDKLLMAHYTERDENRIQAVIKAIKWHQHIDKD